MAGFGGSTGVSKGYVDRAIAQSTAFRVVETIVSVSSLSLAAHAGIGLKSIASYTVTPPTGYKILMHTGVAMNGIGGVFATMDGTNQYAQASPNVYLYNTQNNSITGTANSRVVIYTLCVPS